MASLERTTAPHGTVASPFTSVSTAASPDVEISLAPPTAPSHAFASIPVAVSREGESSGSSNSMAPQNHTSASTSICMSDSTGYDAFINHRGPDVKNTFASHLYHRLAARGLRVFLDKQDLEGGFNFTTQIEAAIRTATIHVAIFSPGYAESKWCLDELLQMLESGAPIIPVFYHVKPAELRGTVLGAQGESGVYSRSLRKLEEKKTYDSETHEEKPRHDPRTIQKWREALSRVSEISGFEVDANNTDEGELLDKVVQVVKREVKKRHPPESKTCLYGCFFSVIVVICVVGFSVSIKS